MNLYLNDYFYGSRMAVVARSEEVYNELMARNIDIMRVSSKSILFQPGNIRYWSEKINSDRLELLCDYDIVEINESGILYRAFANNEADSTIFLGARCNSNCVMCPASDKERKKGFAYSRDLLMRYIDYLPADLEYIVMTGGEPTMQPDLFLESLDRVREKFPHTQVLLLTNGRSLSDKWLFQQVVDRHPEHFRIAIPIHAPNAELHDYITRSPGSFDQTMLGLTRLMNSDITVEVRIVVTKVNCDYLLEIGKLISNNFPRVFCVNFIGLEPRGNCAVNYDSVYLDHRTSFIKSKEAIQYLISCGYDVGLYNYPLCSIDKDYWSIASRSISSYKNVYQPECEECDVKLICGGFFAAAIGIAKPKVLPVKAKGIANDKSL